MLPVESESARQGKETILATITILNLAFHPGQHLGQARSGLFFFGMGAEPVYRWMLSLRMVVDYSNNRHSSIHISHNLVPLITLYLSILWGRNFHNHFMLHMNFVAMA
jgi:hypothetical protein